MCLYIWNIDTAYLTTSAVWNPGPTQSHDMTQLSVTGEGRRDDNHARWHHPQTDIVSNNNSAPRTQTDGGWLASPRASGSQHLFQDTEDSKSVSMWPLFSPKNLSKLNEPSFDQVDKERKTETSNGIFVFGFNLINHCTSSSPIEKAPPQSLCASAEIAELASTLSAAESDPKSDVSKASKERVAGQFQVSPKESQNKQSCSNSTRSRTKVMEVDC